MDLPSWARVGAKVVCVDNAPHPGTGWPDNDQPEIGTVYTIVSFGVNPIGEAALYLAEICRGPRTVAHYGYDTGYALRRFRPLVDQQTDIATHFAHHLKQPEKV